MNKSVYFQFLHVKANSDAFVHQWISIMLLLLSMQQLYKIVTLRNSTMHVWKYIILALMLAAQVTTSESYTGGTYALIIITVVCMK